MWHQEPDGLQFLRPITLSITHSGVDLSLTAFRNMQVRHKAGNKGIKCMSPHSLQSTNSTKRYGRTEQHQS